MRWWRRQGKAQSPRPLSKVPWWARARWPSWIALTLSMGLMAWPLALKLGRWFARTGHSPQWGVLAALGLLLFLVPLWLIFSGKARAQEYLRALAPLPLSFFFRKRLAFLFPRRRPHKTFFVRDGWVVGDRERVERENLRSESWGLAIVDGVSAAVFLDQDQGGLFITGPGVTFLRPAHRLVATVSLRRQVVAYGGNPWSQSPSPTAKEVVVELSGTPVAARLIGIFVLLSPQDYPPPRWHSWLREQAILRKKRAQQEEGEEDAALNASPSALTPAQAKRYREAFLAHTFQTAFHGHGWSVRAFAEAVLTDVLDRVAQHPSADMRDRVPELLQGSVPHFQDLLRSAWQKTISEVGQAERLFERIHEHSELRWIGEVQRVFRERLTQPTYRPIRQTHRKPSEEYWALRAMGLKAVTASIAQVYFPPQYEIRRAEAVYEPLWVFLEGVRGHGQHYSRLKLEREARYHTFMLHTEYMARRWVALVNKSMSDLQASGEAEDLARILLSLTEGSERWLRESARLDAHDPRREHLRMLQKWLRLWWRLHRGEP